LRLQIAKHRKEHILAAEADEILERAVGVTLTEMNQIPALLFPHDLPNRRRVEAVILRKKRERAASEEAGMQQQGIDSASFLVLNHATRRLFMLNDRPYKGKPLGLCPDLNH
jgi:hypothetical protein